MNTARYSIDTNTILTAWTTTYRPKNFPGFWTRFDALIQSGTALISEEVQREIKAKDDDISEWFKSHSGRVVALEEEQILLARALAHKFPVLAKERLGRRRADGFVIALAQWKDLTVVTYENHRGAGKIPAICKEAPVQCITLADMIEAEGWAF